MDTEQKWNRWKNCIGFLLLALGGALLSGYLVATDYQPSGGDIWGHLYKSQVMYESIKQGDFFPAYSADWYNGIELYRYWGPFSYYVMAALTFITGGDLLLAYRLLAGVLFVAGGIPWVIWGNIKQRRVMGSCFGLMWFFVPEHIRIYFTAGNLPQMVTTAMVPYIILFVWLYVKREKSYAAFGLLFGMFFMTLTHLMVTAIMGVSTFLYLLIDQVHHRMLKRRTQALIFMAAGIFTAGIWVVPSLSGGLVASDSGDGSVMSTLIYPLTTSLNPFKRFSETSDIYYFGLAAVVISLAGIFLAKKHRAGFILLLVLLVCTTPAAYAVIVKLPFSQLFWMTRFTPMLYGYFFASCMEWTTLKRKYAAVLVGVLLLDILPCMNIPFYTVQTDQETIADIQTLSEMTSQRTAVVDLSSYGSYPAYGICGENDVMYTFGWAWQGAVTGDNIVLLNESLEREYFLYLFDRTVSLGDDTVLLRKSDIEQADTSFEDICDAAKASGYHTVTETATGYIFKLDAPERFGVSTAYKGLAIGSYANEMTLLYPSFTIGASEVLEDYSVEELCAYDTIFLTGFSYRNREAAEQLIREVGERGTRVVIDSTHVSADQTSKQEIFLGVLAQTVHFEERYPLLTYRGEEIVAAPFDEADADFSTSYITGVDASLGTFSLGGQILSFLGTKEDAPNVYFLGINLMYETVTTGDEALIPLLNDVLGVSNETLPERTLVPLTITYGTDGITIDAAEESIRTEDLMQNGIDTTIADQDIFSSKQKTGVSEHLLVVYDTHTEITFCHPYRMAGCALSAFGVLLAAGGFVWGYRKRRIVS